MTSPSVLDLVSAPSRAAPESGIVEIVNYGREVEGLVKLWVGEGDLPTPAFIADAATRALAAGETFYTWQRGIPPLRKALAQYHTTMLGRPFEPDRFFVTVGGMHAVIVAVRMIVEAGDEVIVPGPAWPNVPAAIELAGGTVKLLPMDYRPQGWTLDLERLEAMAAAPRAKAILINSPANPTGWTADKETLAAILSIARKHGLWILADEVYGRFVPAGDRAASFHDVAEDGERILYVNTFSKNWAMTGWRLGWLEAPPELGQVIENLVQYTTSGVPSFLQHGGIAAIEHGDSFLAYQIERAKRGQAILEAALSESNRVSYAKPGGGFYLFPTIDGIDDTRVLAKRLVDEAGVGVAPGTSFGPGGERFFRLCCARNEGEIRTAAERLADWLRKL